MADKTITVKGSGTPDSKVILWEKDDLHPDGEAWIVGDGKEYTVGETAAVKRLIGDGTLVKADGEASRAQGGEPFGPALGYGGKPAGDKGKDAPEGLPPWPNYDAMDEAQILAYAATVDDAARDRALKYERRNKKRPGVIVPLVNWNS